MPDVSDLYPKPPQPQQGGALSGLMQNPLAIIPALSALQQMQITRQQAPALVQQPAAALNLQRQQLQQDQLRQDLATNDALTAHFAPLANLPNPTAADVDSRAALAATTLRNVPARSINAFSDLILKDAKGRPRDAAGIRQALKVLQTQAAGAGASMQRTETTAPPGFERGTTSLGEQNVSGGAVPLGQPVGQGTVQQASAANAAALENTSKTSPQYHADLANLKQDSRVLGNVQGMTAEAEKRINTTLQRFGIPGLTMSREQLGAADSFDKIVNQISSSQAASVGAATDAGRHMVAGAVPNLEQSKYGREGVIDMLQGNQDFVDRAREAWFDASNARKWGANAVPANVHNAWMAQFARDTDPRVFQVNRMDPERRKQFLADIDPEERAEFTRKWNAARARGWVKQLNAQ